MDFVADQVDDDESIVRTCRRCGVPMFVPALNDSSIGIGLTDHRVRAVARGPDAARHRFDPGQLRAGADRRAARRKTAAIYVAGGVPKNYINDSIVMSYLYGMDRGHDYAIQVTTAVTADGGLSSSTLSEARSWGKIEEEARFAMAWVEPSVALPLLAGYSSGGGSRRGARACSSTWDGYELTSLKTVRAGGPRAGRARGPEMATLFVIATPIGNLEDITHRALRVLGEVPVLGLRGHARHAPHPGAPRDAAGRRACSPTTSTTRTARGARDRQAPGSGARTSRSAPTRAIPA